MDKLRDYFKKHKAEIFWYIVLAIGFYVALTLLFAVNREISKIEPMDYSEYVQRLNNHEIDTVYYNPNEEYMIITLLNDDTKQMSREERDAYKYTNADKRYVLFPSYDEFRKDVLSTNTNLRVIQSGNIVSVMSALVSLIFPLVLIGMVVRMMSMQGQGLKEKSLIQTSTVKFDDIIGHEEILDDVKFITELIKNPTKGEKIGAKVPKGLLLAGPPGTGKTLIAKAIAGEAGVPFLYQNASAFIEMFVGLGAKRVRDLFKFARKHAPCIIFIDEIDAIGGDRDTSRGTSENEQTINALLQEMDGFTGREGIFIIAATNRSDSLDAALVRSGRFDRQIIVNPPRDWKVRRELFKHYLSGFKVSDDIDIDNVSKQISGFTGADVATICNEASIIAVMRDKDAIDTDCIEEAIDKKVFKGNRSKRKSQEKDRTVIAYHESGHAIMSYLLGEPIARASIQSTVSGVGGVVFNQDKETMLETDKDLKHRVMIMYGGRASEEIKFGDVTTGASNDITQATSVLIQYVEKLGMDKDFGLLDTHVLAKEHLLDGSETAKKLGKMSLELYAETKKLLSDNYDKVEILAQKLLEVESLSGEEIDALFLDERDVSKKDSD